MNHRFATLLAWGSCCLPLLLASSENESSTVTIRWSQDIESSGVCVERPEWFVGLVPRGYSTADLGEPTLSKGTGTVKGRILFLENDHGLCLIEANGNLEGTVPFTFFPGTHPKAGEKLECLSNRSACITTVAGLDWAYRGRQFASPLIRVRMSDPEGFSDTGCPLVNDVGELMAILTGEELDGNGETHAIPASLLRKLAKEVARFQKSGPVWVGLVLQDHASTPEVLGVKPCSPAEESGAEPGDVILSVNGADVSSLAELAGVVSSLPAGEEARITVLRGFSEKDLLVTPRFAEIP